MKFALVDPVGVVCGFTRKSELRSRNRLILIQVDEETEKMLRGRPSRTSYDHPTGRYYEHPVQGRWVYMWDRSEFEFVETHRLVKMREQQALERAKRFEGFPDQLDTKALDEIEDLFE